MATMRRALLLFLVLFLTGCGTNVSDLEGTAWRLVDGDESAAVRTVHINSTGLAGFDGCLPWFSESDTSDSPIWITTRLLTDPGPALCDSTEATDAELFRAELEAITDVDVHDDELVLSGDDITLRFEPVPRLDTDLLVDVEWATKFLAASSDLYDMEGSPSFFLFSSDGSFTADTGCRSGSGTWGSDLAAGQPLALTQASWQEASDCGGAAGDVDLIFTRLLDFEVSAYIIDDRLFTASADWSSFAVFQELPG